MNTKTKIIIQQYLITLAVVTLTTLLGHFLLRWFDYQTLGYLYILNVILISAIFNTSAIFLSAIISAVSWNFFFMNPRFTFHIDNSHDTVMYYTFFFVASLGGYFNSRIRKHEKLIAIKNESERLYQTLINSISHELRTPLTVLLGHAHSLQNKELTEASERLNQVVENLLDMSRIESGHLSLKLEVFSIHELIEHSLKRLAPHLKQRSILITKNKNQKPWDDLISGDFKFLDHAVGNLVLNAIRYSPQESKITLEINSNKNSIIFKISNNGITIPDEFKDKIFEKFFRIPGTPTGGIGLGLSIVKGILDAHETVIDLCSQDSLTTFTLYFKKAHLPENIKGALG